MNISCAAHKKIVTFAAKFNRAEDGCQACQNGCGALNGWFYQCINSQILTIGPGTLSVCLLTDPIETTYVCTRHAAM